MWSIGIILYELLCGYYPFGVSERPFEAFQKIIQGKYDFPDQEWNGISDSTKDFIKHLLEVDPKIRFTADECLQHPFLLNC